MKSVQQNLMSMLKEHSARKHLAVVVCMIAIVTAFAVFWSLRISGLTLASEDPNCELQEHTHTDACYDWVATETDGAEEIEETESTEADEEAETTEDTDSADNEDETDEAAAETEDAEALESASEEDTDAEETDTTESADEKSEEADETESTESVTEETEEATEEATEELTEEETEAPQPGDTKVVDGVTYVYELVCGLEEHTHTDECYESDDTEEDADVAEETDSDDEELELTAGVATVSEYGISLASDESGIATVADDDEEEETTTTTTSESYYFADSTTLTTAAGNQDESYIVYTIIDGSYYVVSANDELVPCTYLGDSSDISATDYFDESTISTAAASDGIYCWKNSPDSLAFKCVADGSTVDFADYIWTLSGDATDTDTGKGTYTFYNSENKVYIDPQDVGVSEKLTSDSWWSGTGVGKDYLIEKNSILIITVKCNALSSSDDGEFNVELYDATERSYYGYNDDGSLNKTTELMGYQYLTTGTNNDAWYSPVEEQFVTETSPGGDIVKGESNADITPAVGSEYIITVQRTDNETTLTASYVITYSDSDGNVLLSYTADNTILASDEVYVHIIAQLGTYEISTVYAVDKKVAGTENTSGTYSYDNLTVTSLATVNDTDSLRGKTTLEGDFEITYTFYNAGSSSNTTDHYILGLYDGSGKYVYLWANSSYTESGDSSVASVTKSSEGGTLYPSTDRDWRSYMAAGKSTTNASYTICYVSVSRCKNVITITTVQSRRGSGSGNVETPFYYYTTTIIDESFGTDPVTVFLTGQNCTLTGIYTTVSDPDYDVTGYDSYGAVGEWGTSLALTGTSSGAISVATATSKFLDSVTLAADSTSSMSFVKSDASNTVFYLAAVRSFTAYFDGSNGTVYYSYNGSSYTSNLQVKVESSSMDSTGSYFFIDIPTVTLTDTKGSTDANEKANVTLAGWLDVYNAVYYNLDTTVEIAYSASTDLTVCYADWVATSYNGGNTSDTYYNSAGLDTSGFITTNVFDYNDLFNTYSAYLSSKATNASEYVFGGSSETWRTSYTVSGTETISNLFGNTGWGLMFIKAGGNALLNTSDRYSVLTNGNKQINSSNNAATTGILSSTSTSAVNLLKALFGTYTDTDTTYSYIGKTYLGTGDYLYQHEDVSGYYYFDSEKNAAFYNQNDERFYLYNFNVAYYTTDSNGNAVYSSTGDFFPFSYDETMSIRGSSNDDTTYILGNNVDYYFGMSSEISFYLPENSGLREDNSHSNQTVYEDYSDMVFKFSGDDDVWVVLDYGEETEETLLLDLGGVHGKVYGEINFSTGTVTVVNSPDTEISYTYTDDDGETVTGTDTVVTYDENDIIGISEYADSSYISTTTLKTISSGTHTLTVFYTERGASESNAAIYFNISPVYSVVMTKVGETSSNALDGVEFNLYKSSTFTDEYLVGTYTTDSSGGLTINALVPQTTYYLVETSAAEGYPLTSKYITIYVDTKGYATLTVYTGDGTYVESLETALGYTTTAPDTNKYLILTLSSERATSEEYGSYVVVTFTYANYLEYELPATGSMGIFPYRRAGTVLVLVSITGFLIIAFYHLVWVRKLRTSGNNKGYTEEKGKRGRHFARTRDHPRERSGVHGRDAPAVTFADRGKERSRGTGPGTE